MNTNPNFTSCGATDRPEVDVEVTQRGIVANGTLHEVDCIIYSTGFESTTDLRRRYGINVVEGRGGPSLYDLREGQNDTLHV